MARTCGRKTYDRELNDVFALQEEIAKDVAQALSITLDVGDDEPVPGWHHECRGLRQVPALAQCWPRGRRTRGAAPASAACCARPWRWIPQFALAWDELARLLRRRAISRLPGCARPSPGSRRPTQARRTTSRRWRRTAGWCSTAPRMTALWRRASGRKPIAVAQAKPRQGAVHAGARSSAYGDLMSRRDASSEAIRADASASRTIEPLVDDRVTRPAVDYCHAAGRLAEARGRIRAQQGARWKPAQPTSRHFAATARARGRATAGHAARAIAARYWSSVDLSRHESATCKRHQGWPNCRMTARRMRASSGRLATARQSG